MPEVFFLAIAVIGVLVAIDNARTRSIVAKMIDQVEAFRQEARAESESYEKRIRELLAETQAVADEAMTYADRIDSAFERAEAAGWIGRK